MKRVRVKPAAPSPGAVDIESEAEEEERPRRVSGRQILRRDSLKRREALLKGKEGSRRRQKWENGA